MALNTPTSKLLDRVRACRVCADTLPLGPRPIVQIGPLSRILIAGQAPGKRVHETGIPFDDPSGDTLRRWMGITPETFYDAAKIAIVPMSFCYPGKGASGDLPPDSRCEVTWREQVLAQLHDVRLRLIVGQYAQAWHFGHQHRSVTATVRRWQELPQHTLALPHPSPRNRPWITRNPWFEQALLPELQARVRNALQ